MEELNPSIVLDGTPPKRFVIIALDSIEKAQGFNNSAFQKGVNENRAKNTKSRSFIVEGMQKASFRRPITCEAASVGRLIHFVRTWHFSDIPTAPTNVRYRG
jgi:hypothetical protein